MRKEMLDSVTFYASFDEEIRGDFGRGRLTPGMRYDDPSDPARKVFVDSIDRALYRISPNGISGGALEGVGAPERNGRMYFPAEGNLPYRPDGWSGSVSFWLKTNPDTMLKTSFCDPVQITERGANDGGLWIDFPNTSPRDLRLAAFPSEGLGRRRYTEEEPDAPVVRVPRIGFQAGEWHHIAFVWRNFDTGRADGQAELFIDGGDCGGLSGRNLGMGWTIERTGVYFAVNYIGLLDELAIFDRDLTGEEVHELWRDPALLAGLL